MEVKDKATGKTLVIKDYRFDPELHEKIGTKAPTKRVIKKEELSPRFSELKAKGWVHLNKEEKVEYKDLKSKE